MPDDRAAEPPRILVVDDEQLVLDMVQRVLCRDAGAVDEQALRPAFVVDCAMQGPEAVERARVARDEGYPYALAFVDIRMPPGFDGIETVERLWRDDPTLQVVLCSGQDYTWKQIHQRLGASDGLLLMKKPVTQAEVIQSAHALTRKWVLHRREVAHAAELERLVEQRTSELEQALQQLAEETARRTQMASELRLAQKLEAVGQLASGIAHEINTPAQYVADNVAFLQRSYDRLAGLRERQRQICETLVEQTGQGEQLLAELVAHEKKARLGQLERRVPRAFGSALEGLERISTIVQAMKEFGHLDGGKMAEVDLNRTLQTTLEVCRNEYKYVAEVELDLGELPPVRCLRNEMSQVFLNLIVNAAHAIGDDNTKRGAMGHIRIRTVLDGDDVVIAVSDDGPGVPGEIQERIFDPFFTTKAVGHGTGQGLAISRSIVVDKHAGQLTLTSSNEGATFTVRIPCAAERARAGRSYAKRVGEGRDETGAVCR